MTVIDVTKDPASRSLTITSEFDATPERVWRLWAEPAQLNRWWGPPGWPATFVDHDLSPGGDVRYYMTGPDGEKAGGWWRVNVVEPPHRLEVTDGFADESGNRNDAMPTVEMVVTIAESGGRTRMTIASTYSTLEDMEKVIAMGMEEGITLALGQIDALLSEG